MDKRVITHTAGEEIADKVLVPGMGLGPWLFVSGNAAYDVEEQDIDRQLENALAYQLKTLVRGGSGLDRVFKLDVVLNRPREHAPAVLPFLRRHFPAGRLAVTVSHTQEQPRPYFLVSLVSTALGPHEGGSAMAAVAIHPPGWPQDLPYAPAVRVGDLIFVSGQMGVDPRTGALAAGGVAEQTAQALRNVAEVLAAAGTSMAKVVRGTAYVVRTQQHYLAMNEEYRRHFRPNPPARAIVGVAELPVPGALVQFDFIATI